MEQQFKVTEVIECSTRIHEIFVRSFEKFSAGNLFTGPERLYMYGVFEVWIRDNGNCLDQLARIIDADGKLLEGKEEALDDLYSITIATCAQAEKFEKGFEQLCIKRAKEYTDIEEVRELFATPRN